MSFFILTGAILLGTILIVHFAANAMGFRLFYLSLFLSAMFALSINLIVISMKEVTSPLSIAKIFVAVLFASAFVTVINEILVRREKKKLQKRRSKRREIAKKEALSSEISEETDKSEEEIKEESDKAPKKEGFFKRLFAKFSFSKSKDKKIDEEDIDDTVEKINEVEKIDEDLANDVETDSSEDKVKEDVEKVEEEPKETPKKENFINRLFKKEEKPKREKLDLSKFQDLDALLDYAYDAKISGDYLGAVEAYEGAIEKYENDPYLPFLFIDLGNVHKAQGEYDAAIDIYKKAINMPGIQKDASVVKSFEENVNYLKALKIVLRKRKMEHKPFAEIEESILKETEESLHNQ